jgi:hypothetical protein
MRLQRIDYVMIAQDGPRTEAYTRAGRGWRFEEFEGLEAESCDGKHTD